MQILSYPTETILTNNITRSSRIILSFKVSHRKPLRRRSKGNFHDIVEERSSPTSVPLPDGSKCHSSHLISSSPPTPYLTSSKPKHDLSSILLSSSLPSSSESCFFSFRGMSVFCSAREMMRWSSWRHQRSAPFRTTRRYVGGGTEVSEVTVSLRLNSR